MSNPTGHVTDFDFLVGDWDVANRRLHHRHVGSDEWDEFAGRGHVEQRLGGVLNIEQLDFPDRGWSGATIRSFDVVAQQWSIVWVNSARGVFEPPVVGGFAGDVGTFVGTDVDDGRPVDVVFTWTVLGADRARWEQAFSLDGVEWETNWVMEFRRR
ncbi:MAG: hypothetical protein Q8M22_09470 [Actinomycetota bacterium]|nr:hypothetical protein [Actinomycetota bacterium]